MSFTRKAIEVAIKRKMESKGDYQRCFSHLIEILADSIYQYLSLKQEQETAIKNEIREGLEEHIGLYSESLKLSPDFISSIIQDYQERVCLERRCS